MLRKIVDYKKLNEDILNLLVEKFPDGYDETDIISFRNAQNEIIEAVEVRTEDTIFLVKVGKRLVQAMEDFGDDDDDKDVDEAPEVDFEDVKKNNLEDADDIDESDDDDVDDSLDKDMDLNLDEDDMEDSDMADDIDEDDDID